MNSDQPVLWSSTPEGTNNCTIINISIKQTKTQHIKGNFVSHKIEFNGTFALSVIGR